MVFDVAQDQPTRLKGQLSLMLPGFWRSYASTSTGKVTGASYASSVYRRDAFCTSIHVNRSVAPPEADMKRLWFQVTLTNAEMDNPRPFKQPIGDQYQFAFSKKGCALWLLRGNATITMSLDYMPREDPEPGESEPFPNEEVRRVDQMRLEGLGRLELAKLDDANTPLAELTNLDRWAKANGFSVEKERPRLIVTLRGKGHKFVVAPGCYEMVIDNKDKVPLSVSLVLHDDAFCMPKSLADAITKVSQDRG